MWAAVAQTSSSSTPSIEGGVFVLGRVTLGRPGRRPSSARLGSSGVCPARDEGAVDRSRKSTEAAARPAHRGSSLKGVYLTGIR